MVLLNCCAVPSWRMPNVTYKTSIDILNKPTNPGALLWAHEFASWEDPGWIPMEPILALKWHADFHIFSVRTWARHSSPHGECPIWWSPALKIVANKTAYQSTKMDQCGVFIQKCILCLQTFRIHHSTTQWQVTQSQLTQAGFHRKSSQGRVNSLVILIRYSKNLPIFRWLNVPKDQCVRKNLKGLRHRILKQWPLNTWESHRDFVEVVSMPEFEQRFEAWMSIETLSFSLEYLSLPKKTYCLWKKSCIKWDVTKYHVNHGINYPVNSCRISSINSGNIQGYRVLSRFQRALDHGAWVSVIQSSDPAVHGFTFVKSLQTADRISENRDFTRQKSWNII